ncbi:MAG: nucleotidyltransferase family protein [Acidilobus sp.]
MLGLTLALILAGGYGKRLRPLTDDRPKPLVEVAGKPIIVWQIEWLRKHGVNDIIVLAGYKKEKIIEALGSGSRYGVSVTYVVEDEPLGTGGAVRNARLALSVKEPFLVLNGDIITNIDPSLLLKALESSDAVGAIALVQLRSPYGIVEVGEGGRVSSFKEKPILEGYWINAGVYAFRPEVGEYLPEKGDLESYTFPLLAKEQRLLAVTFDLNRYYWRSIDTYKDLEEASADIEKRLVF